jgi:hypothetical protein
MKAYTTPGTPEPNDPPNPLGTALHGFGLGVNRRILTEEERKEIEARMLERNGTGQSKDGRK